MNLFPKESLDVVNKGPGIYYLYSKEKNILYIGRTVSLRRRLNEHTFLKSFEFFSFETCDVGLAAREKKLLDDYEKQHGQLPPLNRIKGFE